jgi:predicted DNA-binding transcriptional regulator YafY
MKYNQELDMMYQAKDGSVSKRRIKVLRVGDASFKAYCYLREFKRTFRIDSVLALAPVVSKERDVV